MSTLSLVVCLILLVEQAETNRQLDELIYNIENDVTAAYPYR
jgi:hypothetical protein